MADLALLMTNTEPALLNESVAATAFAGNANKDHNNGFARALDDSIESTRRETTNLASQPLSRVAEDRQAVATTQSVSTADGKQLPQSDPSTPMALSLPHAVQGELQQGVLPELPAGLLTALAGEVEEGLADVDLVNPLAMQPIAGGTNAAVMLEKEGVAGRSSSTQFTLNSQNFNSGIFRQQERMPNQSIKMSQSLSSEPLVLSANRLGAEASGLQNPLLAALEGGGKLSSTTNAALPHAPTSMGQLLSAKNRPAMSKSAVSGTVPTLANTALFSGARSSQGLSLSDGWNLQTAAGLRHAMLTSNPVVPAPMTHSLTLPKITESLLPSVINNAAGVNVEESFNLGLLSGIQRVGSLSATGATPMLNIATPVGQQGWASDISQRVAWMAGSELREAQLQLNPRRLGPIEVRIVFGQEQQLNVSFTASNPVTREALDAALPRLREMFEQQGLNLLNSDVSHESFAQQHHRRKAEEESSTTSSTLISQDDENVSESMLASASTIVMEGLIDAYA